MTYKIANTIRCFHCWDQSGEKGATSKPEQKHRSAEPFVSGYSLLRRPDAKSCFSRMKICTYGMNQANHILEVNVCAQRFRRNRHRRAPYLGALFLTVSRQESIPESASRRQKPLVVGSGLWRKDSIASPSVRRGLPFCTNTMPIPTTFAKLQETTIARTLVMNCNLHRCVVFLARQ